MERLVILEIIGIFFIFLGISFLIISSFNKVIKDKNKIEVGVGGFIGPIPFGFFSSKNIFWIWIFIFILFLIFWILIKILIR